MTDKPEPKAKLVWIVTKRKGLHQAPSTAIETAISNDKGRVATDRDLEIAGVASPTKKD